MPQNAGSDTGTSVFPSVSAGGHRGTGSMPAPAARGAAKACRGAVAAQT